MRVLQRVRAVNDGVVIRYLKSDLLPDTKTKLILRLSDSVQRSGWRPGSNPYCAKSSCAQNARINISYTGSASLRR